MMVSLFSFENVHRAYLSCRRGKRSKRSALEFEQRLEENLFRLCQELQSRTYQPAPSSCFVTSKPKHREIFAAEFRDRIIHHLVVSCLEPGWESAFIHDSFACRRHKGTHAAVSRLQAFMWKVTCNGSRRAYCLQVDIRSHFVSIDKQTLFRILCHRIDKWGPRWAEEMKWLLQRIIFHDPTVNARRRGQLSLFNLVPPHKSLTSTANRSGLPIGNYTSQFFANVYLDGLDQFVKHELKVRHYIRYVDDLVLVHEDPKRLECWESAIDWFLQRERKLRLHPRRRKLAPVSNGCDFLGYVVKRTHRLVRRRTVRNCRDRLRRFQSILTIRTGGLEVYRYPETHVAGLFATVMSYNGQFRHASSFKLWRELLADFPFLRFYLEDSEGKWRRKDRAPRRFRCLATQYRWFGRRFRNWLMFFQVGCFFEFYLEQRRKLLAALPLKKGRGRSGLGPGAGMPVRTVNGADLRRLALQHPVAIVRQTGRPAGGTAHRKLATLLIARGDR